MSWFERYAIPGSYFIMLSFALLFPFLKPCLKNNTGLTTLIIGFSTISILPIGFLLSALAQRIYLSTTGVQKSALNMMHNEQTPALDNFYYRTKGQDECWVEAMTHLYNVKCANEKYAEPICASCKSEIEPESNPDEGKQYCLAKDYNDLFSNWIRNRNAVMAMIGSLLLATFITAIVLPLTLLTSRQLGAFQSLFDAKGIYIGTVEGLLLLVFILLFFIRKKIETQVIVAFAVLFRWQYKGDTWETDEEKKISTEVKKKTSLESQSTVEATPHSPSIS